MDIAFHSKALRDVCESEDMLKTKYGEIVGEAIVRRLADLRAAATIRDLVIGAPREVLSGNHPTLCIDLAGEAVLLLRANHLKPPRNASGAISWVEVTRLKIMSIGTVDGQSS
ncbi:MAG: hypothetical protein NW216_07130 [Hyphomicrobium sp.]|nr:hypothetical protein [Hyphomicrobium sp.]